MNISHQTSRQACNSLCVKSSFKLVPVDIHMYTVKCRLPLQGFWAAIAPFNFTAISGHLAGAPAMMVGDFHVL